MSLGPSAPVAAIAAVMEFLNALGKYDETGEAARAIRQEALETVARMLNPITPHAAHAMWQALGHPEALVEDLGWPTVDESALGRVALTLAVQVNGKLRGTLEVAVDAPKDTIEALALAQDYVKPFTEGLTIRKVIVVPGKIVNIVAG